MRRSRATKTSVRWPACPSPSRSISTRQGFATTNGLKLQRDLIAQQQQPGDRQSAQGRRGHSRAHQLPGVFVSLVHHQSDPWRYQKSARSRHHAGRLVRRRGGGGRGGHRAYRARHRHRGIDPLSRLCLWRSWPAADRWPDRGLQCVVARTHHRAADQRGLRSAGAHHRRSQDRAGGDVRQGRARSLVGAGAAAKGLRCRSGRRSVFIPTVSRPSPK